MTLACGAVPPASIAAWWKEADAIIRVRIDSQYAYDRYRYWNNEENVDFCQSWRSRSLRYSRRTRSAVAAGATMTITHPGGTLHA